MGDKQKPNCFRLSSVRDTSSSETRGKEIKMNADVYHNGNMQMWAHGNNTTAGYLCASKIIIRENNALKSSLIIISHSQNSY